jgi:putative transposase
MCMSVVNGMPDHVHLLFLQNPSRAMTEIIKNIKGNSSHWINQNELCDLPFSWQTGYAAFSVSDEILDRVCRYVANQKLHHESETFMGEYKNLIELHRMNFDQ